MKPNNFILVPVMLLLGFPGVAAPFDSGSRGTYGPMNITTDTLLNLPSDGIFHCTTVNIGAGATLSFNRNPLNTPVYILATGQIEIKGALDISGGSSSERTRGNGGPGGFDGGDGGLGGRGFGGTGVGGDGQGPGGGRNLDIGAYSSRGGAYGGAAPDNTNTYGSALIVPLVGGSGGAGASGNPGNGGGGGGGAILIASSTRITVEGQVRSLGGSTPYAVPFAAGGSGGAIRLVAPIVTGNGTIVVNGGGYAGAGYGRIRIDSQDRVARRSLNADPPAAASSGSQMYVNPPVPSGLAILEAAGQSIPEGSPNPVSIILPANSETNRTVVVQARNFSNDVAISIVVTPNDRRAVTYPATIVMTNNPARISVPVVIPSDSTSRIYVWTR